MGNGFSSTLLAVSWAEMTAGTVLMAGRLYVCGFITRQFKLDWWLALGTYLLALAAQISITIGVYYGVGEHLSTLSGSQVENNQLLNWIFTTFAVTSIWVGKLAIIAFILQIEGASIKTWRKWVLYALGGSNVIINIALYPIIWLQCTPTAKMWNNDLPGNCNGRELNSNYGSFQGSYGAFVDFALAVYPMLVFYNLQLAVHIKIGLCVLFSFGVVATTCAAIKVKQLGAIGSSDDITFDTGKLDIWAITEMWVVLIVSCIPTIRPIFIRLFKSVYDSTQRSRGRTGYVQQSSTDKRTRNTYSVHGGESKLSRSIPTTNDSEENILVERDGIMMTRKISVHYESPTRSEDRVPGYTNAFDGDV